MSYMLPKCSQAVSLRSPLVVRCNFIHIMLFHLAFPVVLPPPRPAATRGAPPSGPREAPVGLSSLLLKRTDENIIRDVLKVTFAGSHPGFFDFFQSKNGY